MEIGLIFVYSLFTILQIFILLSSGMISFLRRIYTSDSLKKLSMILLNLFFPVQGMLEIARMATPANVKIFWIMVVTVTFSMFLGFFSGLLLNWIFGLDVRIKRSYALILALPSLGTLPLVLGKAFCYPGGPLEGDSQCSNMLGYMNINSLIFNLILFISGFSLIISDKNLADEIEMKMSYSWPLICDEIFDGKNYTVLKMFQKYMTKISDPIAAELEFEKFDDEIRLINVPGKPFFVLKNSKGEIYNHRCDDIIEKQIEKIKQISNNIERKDDERKSIQSNQNEVEFKLNEQLLDEDPIRKKKNAISEEKNIKFIESHNKSNFENSRESRYQKISLGENDVKLSFHEEEQYEEDEEYQKDKKIEEENGFFKKNSIPNEGNLEFRIIPEMETKNRFERKKSIRFSKLNFENLFDGVKNFINVQSFKDFRIYVGNFLKVNQEKIIKFKEDFRESKSTKFLRKELKYENDIIVADDNKNLRLDYSLEKKKKLLTKDYKNFLDHKLKVIRSNTFNLEKNPVMVYFGKLFEKVEEFRYKESETGFDLHEDNMYHIDKINILIHLHGKEFKDDPDLNGKVNDQIYNIHEKEEKKLLEIYFDHDHPPSFPIARGVNLTNTKVKKIRSIWNDYETCLKSSFSDFELVLNPEPSDFSLIANKIYSPIIMGSILGLLIGISGMRDILFSTNHYITNLVEGILIISKAAVPFLYISVGVQFLTMQKLDLNMTLSKAHIIISLIHRYIFIPGIGLLWVWLWTEYYGGPVKESKVFRIALFIPFCVPCSSNISMLVNLIGYFKEETSMLLLIQNLSMLLGLTILYLVYFIVIGS